jgi:hypothetical protein
MTARAEPHVLFNYEKKTIAASEVEVRAGPSPKFYATLKLHRGDVVEVVTNAKQTPPGWLAIKPPRGSFSWIKALLVQQDHPSGATVFAEGAPVLVGSSLSDLAPNVRATRLARGSQVVIVGTPLVCSDGSKWFPIAPHPSEVRYIPATAINPNAPVQTLVAKGPPTTGPGTSDVSSQDPLLRQAEDAEKKGDYAEAERLYRQLANQTNDQQVRLLCQNRLAALQGQAAARGGNASSGILAGTNQKPSPAAATTMYGTSQSGSAAAGTPQYTGWSDAGVLRKTSFSVDGKQVYALEYEGKSTNPLLKDQLGVVYTTGPQGASLDSYVNRKIRLYGQLSYRDFGGIRAWVLSATHTQMLQ